MGIGGNMKKQMTIFDWVKEIIQTKTNYREFDNDDFKSFDPYMIHLVLSMNPDYIEIVDEIQGLNNISKEKLYRMYADLIPKNSRTYYAYIKSKSAKLDETKVRYIAELYECSYQEANEYLNIMPKEWLSSILDKFGLDEKEKKNIKS